MNQTSDRLLPPASTSSDAELFSPYDVLSILGRRYHWILICTAIIFGLTSIVCWQWPDEYRADTLILVDPQKVPEKYVSTTVSMDVSGRLSTINQQLMSSTRLQKIIDNFELYKNLKKIKTQEEIIEQMRKDIRVEVVHNFDGGGGRNMALGAFRIYYHGRTPSVVSQVCNQLASLFIEENLKVREAQAEGTAEFIDTRLELAKKQLDEEEAKLRDYKLKNVGQLPEQEAALLSRVGQLQAQLMAETEGLSRDKQQEMFFQAQLAQVTSAAKAAAAASGASAEGSDGVRVGVAPMPGSEALSRLKGQKSQLEGNYEQLRLRYKDDWPEVKRAKIALDSLNKQIEAEEARLAALPPPAVIQGQPPAAGNTAKGPVTDARDPAAAIRTQLVFIQSDIQLRTQKQTYLNGQLQSLQSKIDAMPAKEQEMGQTQRDVLMLRTNYQSLMEKKQSADMSQDLEKRQKSERFTILDPARIPEKPYRPDRPIILTGGFAFGLLFGLGMVFLSEITDQSVKKEEEIGKLGLRVLGRIPLVVTAEESRMRRRNKFRNWAMGTAATSAVLAVLGLIAWTVTRLVFLV